MPATTLIKSRIRYTIALLLSLLVAGCAANNEISTHKKDSVEIVKSNNDQRDYRFLTLENGLQAIVISDPDADKAAASLDVNVGSGDNPPERPGLAHFLEHMLFLGTDKYPVADDYQAFISKHGGRHNAYTSLEHTNYYFDIDPDFLEPTLDRFSRFFIAPLFNPEYVDREKHAVDSEYQTRRKNDAIRQLDVLKTITHPDHPFSKFSVGSLETLVDEPNDSLRDALLEFYAKYYSANIMRLVVIGPQSLEELETLVEAKFAEIPNRDVQLSVAEVPPLTPDSLPMWVSIEPVKDIRNLSLNFPIPDIQPHYLAKPTVYIGHILGHEGEGSLLSLLKSKGWAEELSAGVGMAGRGFATFQISISLTEAGNENLEEIIALTFDMVNLIPRGGIEEWRHNEVKGLKNIAFNFQEKGRAINYASRLASALHDYPPQQVLRAFYAMDNFNPKLIRQYLDHLTPNNLLVTHVAKGVTTDQVSPWYDAPYRVSKLPTTLFERLDQEATHEALALPKANPFIPQRFALQSAETDSAVPSPILQQQGLTAWHKTDTSFGAPRGNFYITVRSPEANRSAKHAALTSMLVRTVNVQLSEFSYPALLAGLDYQLYKHVRGISVRVNGYHDKQQTLLSEILHHLKSGKVDDKKFAIHKADFMRDLRNTRQEKPFRQAMGKVSSLLITPSWDDEALLAALEPLSAEDLRRFHPKFFAELEIVTLANGNYSQQDALAMTELVKSTLLADTTPTQVARARVAKLQNAKPLLYHFPVNHTDSAIVVYYQGDSADVETRALFALANQIVSTPFYYQLRTQKQLGYSVFSYPFTIMDAPALSFVVQSPNTSAADLDQHIDAFIDEFVTSLNAMGDDEFAKHKQAVLTKLLEKDKNLAQRSNRYWYEIDRENAAFDSREQIAEALRGIKQEEFTSGIKDYLLKDRKRLLTLLAEGSKHPTDTTQLSHYKKINDIRALQKLDKTSDSQKRAFF